MQKQQKGSLQTTFTRYWAKPRANKIKMDEAEVTPRRIEIDQEKGGVYKFCLQWKDNVLEKAALDRVLNERAEKELVDLAPRRILLIRKEKIKKRANTDETIIYLKCMYSTHNEEPRTLIFQPTSLLLKQWPTVSKMMKILD